MLCSSVSFAPQTIEAIAQVISGGAGNDTTPPIGIYRSGPKIERFMWACGVDLRIGNQSRLPALTNALLDLNRRGETDALQRIIEAAAAPQDFLSEPERLQTVLKYLNVHLAGDGVELQQQGARVRLCKAGATAPVISALDNVVRTIDFDTVQREIDRALANAETDPEDAVTAANAALESVCRSILLELGLPLPERRDLTSLYKAVREPLGLGVVQVSKEIAEDVQQVLGSLTGVVQGVGALRTHAGDAHGREKGFRRIDARIARLAIHSAGSASLFLIETWQYKFPTKPLIAR